MRQWTHDIISISSTFIFFHALNLINFVQANDKLANVPVDSNFLDFLLFHLQG